MSIVTVQLSADAAFDTTAAAGWKIRKSVTNIEDATINIATVTGSFVEFDVTWAADPVDQDVVVCDYTNTNDLGLGTYYKAGGTFLDDPMESFTDKQITNCADIPPSIADNWITESGKWKAGSDDWIFGGETVGNFVKHFWSMEETGPLTTLADVVAGADLISGLTFSAPNVNPFAIRMSSAAGNGDELAAPLFVPGLTDYIQFSCGYAVEDAVATGWHGEQGFYYGYNAGGNDTMAVHSYIQRNGLCANGVAIPPYGTESNDYTRVNNGLYAAAGCRRSDKLAFFSNHILDGSVPNDIVKRGEVDPLSVSEMTAGGNNWPNIRVYEDKLYLGHGGDGLRMDPDTIPPSTCNTGTNTLYSPAQPAVWPGFSSTTNDGFEYLGLCMLVFPNGLPRDGEIVEGLNWMKEQWAQGNKSIYPNWST